MKGDPWHQVTGGRNGVGGWRAQGILLREQTKPVDSELEVGEEAALSGSLSSPQGVHPVPEL